MIISERPDSETEKRLLFLGETMPVDAGPFRFGEGLDNANLIIFFVR